MNYHIRQIKETDYPLLDLFLYHAIYVPKGVSAPLRSITQTKELQRYITGFGKQTDDIGLVVEIDHHLVGMIWVRIMDDYGHIDAATPSLAMALLPSYRGLGIGTALLNQLCIQLQKDHYPQVSLSVQKENHAVHMYSKAGFKIIRETQEEYIMVKKL